MQLNDLIKTLLTSWPSMTTIVALLFIFKFQKEIKRKIRGLVNLGGDEGASWKKTRGGKLPNKGPQTFNEEYQRANETILGLSSKNDELLKLAQDLNKELEDTRVMLFFERILRAMTAWQYFLLKVGCEAQNRRISLQDALIKIKEAYPDFDQYVTYEYLIATLDDLQSLNFLRGIRPYTKETPLEFTELTMSFLVYVNNGNLSL